MSMAIDYANNYSSIFLLQSASITKKMDKSRMPHVIGGVKCMGVKERR